MTRAYYNEFDKQAAAWLRELIRIGAIADGDVDERSIEDVLPSDLLGYTQCHFFAGIGGWNYALRLAGWPDDRPVWTGSCPCQPFSAAGKGAAFDDERHLWPAFHHLIKERKPTDVFGEQVASKYADAWIDLVQSDMEGLGYAFGAVPFPSASVGAPHIRDRTYWVAKSVERVRCERRSKSEANVSDSDRAPCLMGKSGGAGLEGLGRGYQAEIGRKGTVRSASEASESCGMAYHYGYGCQSRQRVRPVCKKHDAEHGKPESGMDDAVSFGRGARRDDDAKHDGKQLDAARNADRSGQANGHWRDADWLYCRDGKWRQVEPGTFPLVDGLPRGVVPSSRIGMAIDASKTAEARVMSLRGYGNAINPIQAAEFVRAFMDSYK